VKLKLCCFVVILLFKSIFPLYFSSPLFLVFIFGRFICTVVNKINRIHMALLWDINYPCFYFVKMHYVEKYSTHKSKILTSSLFLSYFTSNSACSWISCCFPRITHKVSGVEYIWIHFTFQNIGKNEHVFVSRFIKWLSLGFLQYECYVIVWIKQ